MASDKARPAPNRLTPSTAILCSSSPLSRQENRQFRQLQGVHDLGRHGDLAGDGAQRHAALEIVAAQCRDDIALQFDVLRRGQRLRPLGDIHLARNGHDVAQLRHGFASDHGDVLGAVLAFVLTPFRFAFLLLLATFVSPRAFAVCFTVQPGAKAAPRVH